MKSRTLIAVFSTVCLAGVFLAGAAPVGTAFTYQGQLKQGGNNVNATADFQFSLWDAASGPNQIGSTQSANAISVANGVFTATIDFGPGAFGDNARWLEVTVRTPAGSGSFTTLTPRQRISIAPVAGFALNASSLTLPFIATDPTSPISFWITNSVPGGQAIYGYASDSSTANIGIVGRSDSPNGVAVAGLMGATNGANIGVFGSSNSPSGTGVRGDGGSYGVWGFGSTGVQGEGSTIGVFGHTTNTISGIGVFGLAEASEGNVHGVHGISNSPSGVGVYGENQAGSGSGIGLYGKAFSASGYALYSDGPSYFAGNVGLGTANPTFRLQLSTDSAAKPTSNTWTIASDARLKKNIHQIEHALDDLLALRGVTYQWIDPDSQGGMDGTYTGMIAQDVEKVFPEWVRTGANGYKNLTVIGFEGLTVEALRQLRQEKDAQIEALRAENDQIRGERDFQMADLQATIGRLLRRVESLEQRIPSEFHLMEKAP